MKDEIIDKNIIKLLTKWGKCSKNTDNIGWKTSTSEHRLMKEGLLIPSTANVLNDDPVVDKVEKVVCKMPPLHKNILCVRFIYSQGRQLEADKVNLSKAGYANRLNMALSWFSCAYGTI